MAADYDPRRPKPARYWGMRPLLMVARRQLNSRWGIPGVAVFLIVVTAWWLTAPPPLTPAEHHLVGIWVMLPDPISYIKFGPGRSGRHTSG